MDPQKHATVPGSEVALSPLELLADPKSESWISEEVVVAFVEEFERAHQYFLCKEHVKQVCDGYLKAGSRLDDMDTDEIAYEIANENYRAHKFNLLDMDDVLHPVEDYIWRFGTQDRDPYEYRNAIFYLVFCIREKGCVLDKNPRVELEKLRKFTPLFYHSSLVCWEPPVEREARTVIVKNIAITASGKDVWRFFRSCGELEHVEMKSGRQGQVAYITCKSILSANYAQDLKDFAPKELCHKKKSLLIQFQSKHVPAASGTESVVKKPEDVRAMYVEAVKKYESFFGYYKQFQLERGAEKEDVSFARDECWDDCEWMRKEASVNGGFSVRGLRVPEETL